MDPLKSTQRELYEYAVRHCVDFLATNQIPGPIYFTYEDAFTMPSDNRTFRMLYRLAGGPLQGTATGWYKDGYVFVNLPKCAKPVANPFANRRSYPGNKTDRTPVGVVAHETGHHVEAALYGRRLTPRHGETWRALIKKTKAISGYEPVPSESWAETLRLFILNPDLLKQAVPARYNYVTQEAGLIPHEQRDFRAVLNHHPAYIANVESWIAKTK
jgi:hypothetical protein